ncbi:MAG: LysR family transcriptional regulator [Pseudomonadota bacterium]
MKDLPPLQWLRVFESSARHLSFTRAAEELSVTQSAVSQQIKLLENFVGEPLFLRGPRSLQLTATGSTYLPDIQAAIQMLRQSTRSHFIHSTPDRITIRCNWSFSVLWLAPRIESFMKENAGLSVNIVPAIWESDYNHREDDIEIRFGTRSGGENEYPLSEQIHCFPMCSRSLAKQIKQPGDFFKFGRINSLGTATPWEGIYEICGVELPESYAQNELSTHGYMLAVEMARCHLGVMLGLSFISDALLERGDLIRLFDFELAVPEVYYLKANRERLDDNENRFCDWLLRQSRTGQ